MLFPQQVLIDVVFGHNNLFYRRFLMDKYIEFDIDSKKTILVMTHFCRGLGHKDLCQGELGAK